LGGKVQGSTNIDILVLRGGDIVARCDFLSGIEDMSNEDGGAGADVWIESR